MQIVFYVLAAAAALASAMFGFFLWDDGDPLARLLAVQIWVAGFLGAVMILAVGRAIGLLARIDTGMAELAARLAGAAQPAVRPRRMQPPSEAGERVGTAIPNHAGMAGGVAAAGVEGDIGKDAETADAARGRPTRAVVVSGEDALEAMAEHDVELAVEPADEAEAGAGQAVPSHAAIEVEEPVAVEAPASGVGQTAIGEDEATRLAATIARELSNERDAETSEASHEEVSEEVPAALYTDTDGRDRLAELIAQLSGEEAGTAPVVAPEPPARAEALPEAAAQARPESDAADEREAGPQAELEPEREASEAAAAVVSPGPPPLPSPPPTATADAATIDRAEEADEGEVAVADAEAGAGVAEKARPTEAEARDGAEAPEAGTSEASPPALADEGKRLVKRGLWRGRDIRVYDDGTVELLTADGWRTFPSIRSMHLHVGN